MALEMIVESAPNRTLFRRHLKLILQFAIIFVGVATVITNKLMYEFVIGISMLLWIPFSAIFLIYVIPSVVGIVILLSLQLAFHSVVVKESMSMRGLYLATSLGLAASGVWLGYLWVYRWMAPALAFANT